MASPTILQICHLARKTECPGSHITSLCPQHPTMAHTKAAVAGKTSKAKERYAKKLEKRVANLEKEIEQEKWLAKCWRENILKEQRDFVAKILVSKKSEAPEVTNKKSWQALKALNKTLTRHMTRP